MYAGENAIQETATNLSTSGVIVTNRVFGIGTDSMLAYETDDTTLGNTDSEEYAFCASKVAPSSADFTKYGWTALVNRCNDLQNQYTTTARKMFFIQKDHLGSTIALTDSSGSLIQSYKYDVYGSVYVSSGTGFVAMKDFIGNLHGNSRFFTGREYDGEINLYYLRARYYDASVGRFISRDPIGQVDDVNLYGYVGNKPLRFVDLMGLGSKPAITANLVVSIFDIALKNTDGFNFVVFREWTKNRWAFDIKRSSYIQALASKNNWIVNFNWVNIEPSNLWNLLAGFNMKNSYLPSWKVRDEFMSVEVVNAQKEWYWKYSEEIAKWDENSDVIWYDKWEEIYSQYKNATTKEQKIDIITSAIQDTNAEYDKRSRLEQEKRNYYSNLLHNQTTTWTFDIN